MPGKAQNKEQTPPLSWQSVNELEDILARFAEGHPAHIACGLGWQEIIATLHRQIKQIYPDYQILQVKEKYGGLRFYFEEGDLLRGPALSFEKKNPYPDPKDQAAVDAWWKALGAFEDSEEGRRKYKEDLRKLEEIEVLVDQAEALSLLTCEICGGPGQMREWRGKTGEGSPWQMTRCDSCWRRQIG